jgi:cellulose biosynthesis protein BcsE
MSITLLETAQSRQPALVAQSGTVCAIAGLHAAHPGDLVWTALLAAAGATTRPGAPAWLLTTRLTPGALTPSAALAPACDAALESGRIRILRHHLVRPGPPQIRTILAELEHFAIAANGLLIIDCADRWLDKPTRGGQALLIESLQKWAQRRQVAVVLVFHGQADGASDRAADLLGFAPHLSGILRLVHEPAVEASARPARLLCRLLFWFGQASVQADTELVLEAGEDGRLRIDDGARCPANQQIALDTDVVIVQRSALAGSGGAPPHWIVCDTLDQVLAACATAQAATVILTFERTTPQDYLMRTVYLLRRRAGNRLKIIVRELHVRLRYNEEALIARLGASLIVPMEVGYARLLSMMEMQQNLVFGGMLPPTFEQAVADGLPQEAAGYLEPDAFARTVAATLARSRALAIDNVLVRLTLGSGLTALDAMRHCTIRRAGDLFSGDRKSVLVFLFACREMDATQTLERIFALPVGEMFSSEHRYISNLAATAAIEEFGSRAATGRLPDLTEPLAQMRMQRQPSAPGDPPATVQTTVRTTVQTTVPTTTPADGTSQVPVAAPPTHAPLSLRPVHQLRAVPEQPS